MSITMFSRGSVPVVEALMQFTRARHKAIANNIANVETVGYKAMDVDVAGFQKTLARALEARRSTPTGVFEMGPSRNVGVSPDGLSFRTVDAPETGILKHIDNNVDLDIEMGKLVKNGALQNLASTVLAHQFTMMREAIGERVSG